MTAPTEPTPGAPAGTSNPEPASTPAPTAPPVTQPQAGPVEDIASLPEWAQKMIGGLRGEAGKARTDAKAAAAAEARTQALAEVAKALGLAETEDPLDPERLSAQLGEASDRAWTAGVELNVFKLAPSLGADPEALLDSMSFIRSLDDLVDLDPRSPEFKTALQAKVQEAAAKYPAKTAATGQAPATGPRPDPSQGARGATPARPTSLTDALTQHYGARR